MGLKGNFGSLPTRSVVEPFNREDAFGVTVVFSEAGLGFGEITFCVDKATGAARLDHGGLPLERCARIVERAAEVRRTGGVPG